MSLLMTGFSLPFGSHYELVAILLKLDGAPLLTKDSYASFVFH